MTTALGKITFLDTPDVSGDLLVKQTDLDTELTNTAFAGTSGIVLPSGTTAQRPAGVVGTTRFNTTTGLPEIYAQGTWLPYARVIQTASAAVGSQSITAVAPKTTTSIPVWNSTTSTGDAGITAWTANFTPLVSGSSLVIQYALTGYLSVASRAMYSAVFVGTTGATLTCIGMTTASTQAAAAAFAVGTVPLAMQAVVQTTSTAPLIILCRVGHLNATAGNTSTIGLNQSLTSGNFGSAMNTEYRILEIF